MHVWLAYSELYPQLLKPFDVGGPEVDGELRAARLRAAFCAEVELLLLQAELENWSVGKKNKCAAGCLAVANLYVGRVRVRNQVCLPYVSWGPHPVRMVR